MLRTKTIQGSKWKYWFNNRPWIKGEKAKAPCEYKRRKDFQLTRSEKR